MVDSLTEFNKYFNRDFWRAFRNKQVFLNIPENKKDKDRLIKNLYKQIQSNQYYPSVPELYIDKDKGNFVTRIIPVFKLEDYCVYYYCIKKIESKIAFNRIPNTFGGWTLGGLMRKSEEDEMEKRRKNFNKFEDFLSELNGVSVTEYSFNPAAWAKAYGDLNAKLYATAKESEFKYVAELDIANYYDSIRLDILEIKIREICEEKDADIISLLFHFLNYWNRKVNLYNKQTVGIPQDALGDCSRILANYYLQVYDKYAFTLCKKSKCQYLRYADDQFLFSGNKEDLEQLIFKLSKKLNSLGLSVNQKKVRIIEVGELINSRAFEAFDILKDKKDRQDKKLVEKFVDIYLSILDAGKLGDLKDNGRTFLNRIIFCKGFKKINSDKKVRVISQFLQEKYLYGCKSSYFEEIYKLLQSKEKIDFIKNLKKLSLRYIHNSFHYEVLDFFIKNKIDGRAIKKRITFLKQQ